MSKIYLAIFFATSFMIFTVAPAMVMLFDNDSEIIEFYQSAEEEESKDEKKFEKDIVLIKVDRNFKSIDAISNNKLFGGDIKDSNPHINLVLPPPERA